MNNGLSLQETISLLEDSKGFRALNYYPHVMMSWKELCERLGFTQRSMGHRVRLVDLKGIGEAMSYAFVRREFPLDSNYSLRTVIVDILADVHDGDLSMELKSHEALQLGGLHEFVKANINDPLSMSLACEVYYG